jgi:hypothetical protein
VRRTIEAALSMANPLHSDKPERLWMDWGWFTDIIILKSNGGGAGMVSKRHLLLEHRARQPDRGARRDRRSAARSVR